MSLEFCNQVSLLFNWKALQTCFLTWFQFQKARENYPVLKENKSYSIQGMLVYEKYGHFKHCYKKNCGVAWSCLLLPSNYTMKETTYFFFNFLKKIIGPPSQRKFAVDKNFFKWFYMMTALIFFSSKNLHIEPGSSLYTFVLATMFYTASLGYLNQSSWATYGIKNSVTACSVYVLSRLGGVLVPKARLLNWSHFLKNLYRNVAQTANLDKKNVSR